MLTNHRSTLPGCQFEHTRALCSTLTCEGPKRRQRLHASLIPKLHVQRMALARSQFGNRLENELDLTNVPVHAESDGGRMQTLDVYVDVPVPGSQARFVC